MPAAASLGSETYGWEHAPNGGRGEVRQSRDSTSMLPKHSSSSNSEPNGRSRDGAGPGEKSETGKHAGSSGEQSRLLRDILCRAGPERVFTKPLDLQSWSKPSSSSWPSKRAEIKRRERLFQLGKRGVSGSSGICNPRAT